MIMNSLVFQILNIVLQSLLDKSNFKRFDFQCIIILENPLSTDIVAFLKDTLKTIELGF